MIIEHFLFADKEEVNSFLIACPESRRAMIIDAGGFDSRLEQVVEKKQLSVEKLLITHAHSDHTGAVEKLYELFPDIELIAFNYSYGNKIHRPTDGEEFQMGALKGRYHHVPGHTADMLVLFVNGHLFTGDVIFAGSVGGTTDQNGYQQQIEGIREKLLVYPDDTVIHPGHGPNSTIGLEKSYNPFL